MVIVSKAGVTSYKCSVCNKKICKKTELTYGGKCERCSIKSEAKYCSQCNNKITKASFLNNGGLCCVCNAERKAKELNKPDSLDGKGKKKRGPEITLDYYDSIKM